MRCKAGQYGWDCHVELGQWVLLTGIIESFLHRPRKKINRKSSAPNAAHRGPLFCFSSQLFYFIAWEKYAFTISLMCVLRIGNLWKHSCCCCCFCFISAVLKGQASPGGLSHSCSGSGVDSQCPQSTCSHPRAKYCTPCCCYFKIIIIIGSLDKCFH